MSGLLLKFLLLRMLLSILSQWVNLFNKYAASQLMSMLLYLLVAGFHGDWWSWASNLVFTATHEIPWWALILLLVDKKCVVIVAIVLWRRAITIHGQPAATLCLLDNLIIARLLHLGLRNHRCYEVLAATAIGYFYFLATNVVGPTIICRDFHRFNLCVFIYCADWFSCFLSNQILISLSFLLS